MVNENFYIFIKSPFYTEFILDSTVKSGNNLKKKLLLWKLFFLIQQAGVEELVGKLQLAWIKVQLVRFKL